ncbi:phosphotransferase (plasmid) [Streptomyces sp. BHT-5-2]|uniref:phosphotransferase enzyme family protein n=1 Tax=Streptomyces sp. BHT-5-2 TaxID=2866715 RepID=UPI001C8EA206|nr:phosphotransferase [Streptomyces sp. BHT-5-2]QZL07825.1 phosphotransferase [Streptomyces sp. BHT-5-2]
MVIDADELVHVLGLWGRPVTSVKRLAGGWNSTSWLVRGASGDRHTLHVAKLADSADGDAFRSGLRVAGAAAVRGFPSGAPVPTVDGRLTVDVPEGVLGLLRYVPGRSPSATSEADLRRVGSTLARAQLAVREAAECVSEQHRWPWAWADVCLREVPMAPGVRAAAARALDEARAVTARSSPRMGVVHGDPGLDAFRLCAGSVRDDGLIDWGAAMEAPLLYDLASFGVMTRGTPRALLPCLEGYRLRALEVGGELRHFDALVRLRWVCHVLYFASRLARGIVRGAASGAENEERLAEAYASLRGDGNGAPDVLSPGR